jgi:hypothetical protein
MNSCICELELYLIFLLYNTVPGIYKEDPMKQITFIMGIILLLLQQLAFTQEGNSSAEIESSIRQGGIISKNEYKTDYQNYINEINPNTKTPPFDNTGNPRKYSWYKLDSFPMVNVAPGIQAISVNFENKKLSLVDSITPINATFNIVQRKLVHWYQDSSGNWNKEVKFISLWSPSIGLLFKKTEEEGNEVWMGGISIIPIQIKVEDFCIGLGIDWRSTDKVEFKKANFNFDIPITYQFGL